MATPAPITAASNNTPITGATTYCTGTQFMLWFDLRSLADYLSDTTTPIGAILGTDPLQIDKVVVAADPTLGSILQAASGMLEMALLKGDRYTPGDLILLTTGPMATSNAALTIARVVAGIAAPDVIRRRPDLQAPKLAIIEESQEFLKALADGDKILPIQEAADAGRMENQTETLADVESRFMPSFEARRLFGTRNKWRDTP